MEAGPSPSPAPPLKAEAITARDLLRRDLFTPEFLDHCRGAFRGLNTDAERTAVIAITSPQRREGRSSVAAGLALAIATDTGQRVMLLDLDLAHASQGRLFGVRCAPGLSDYVAGAPRLRAVADGDRQLWLLPAGSRGPHAMLDASMATGLFRACRERVRWVIADLPPLLESEETGQWCAAADACLVVGRYRSTTVEALARSARRLDADQPAGFLMTADSGLPERIRRWL
jgi:Mrp family chromosome partitioning ATPase